MPHSPCVKAEGLPCQNGNGCLHQALRGVEAPQLVSQQVEALQPEEGLHKRPGGTVQVRPQQLVAKGLIGECLQR